MVAVFVVIIVILQCGRLKLKQMKRFASNHTDGKWLHGDLNMDSLFWNSFLLFLPNLTVKVRTLTSASLQRSLVNSLLPSLPLEVLLFTLSSDFCFALVGKTELSTAIQPGGSHFYRPSWLCTGFFFFLKEDMFNWCFLLSRILLYCSQIMPHLERKMNYSRQFVQNEAKSFATVKYCTQIWKYSILRTG